MPTADTSPPPPPKAPAKRAKKTSVPDEKKSPDLFERLDWSLAVAQSKDEEELLLSSLFPIIPSGVTVDRTKFASAIALSFSLSFQEKKRVFDSMPELSQFQVDELVKTFDEERIQFAELVDKEQTPIFQLYVKAVLDWAVFLYGSAFGSIVMRRLIQQALPHGKAFWIPERCTFDAEKSYFWVALYRAAVFAGAGDETVSQIEARFVKAIDPLADDRYEFELLNALYSNEFEPDWDGRVLCHRRIQRAVTLLEQVTIDDATSDRDRVLSGRSRAFGINRDYEYLGRTNELHVSIEKALATLDKAQRASNVPAVKSAPEPGTKVSALFNRAVSSNDAKAAKATSEHLLYHWLFLDVRLGNPIEDWEYRERLFEINKERIDARLVHALTFSAYGRLNVTLLRTLLVQRHVTGKVENLDLLSLSINWLCWTVCIGETKDLDDCIDTNYNLLTQELQTVGETALGHMHEWRSLYAYARTFEWIAESRNQEYAEDIKQRLDEKFGDNFFKADRTPLPKGKQDHDSLFYRCVRTVEAPSHEPALIEEIKKFDQRYDACFYLYIIASCDRWRGRCSPLARTISRIPDHRLIGIPFAEALTARFDGFISGAESFAGAQNDVERWKGDWTYDPETGFTSNVGGSA